MKCLQQTAMILTTLAFVVHTSFGCCIHHVTCHSSNEVESPSHCHSGHSHGHSHGHGNSHARDHSHCGHSHRVNRQAKSVSVATASQHACCHPNDERPVAPHDHGPCSIKVSLVTKSVAAATVSLGGDGSTPLRFGAVTSDRIGLGFDGDVQAETTRIYLALQVLLI